MTETRISGRYRLERRLGVGGMSTVQLAFDERLERSVAVKLLAEHLADDPSFVSRFRREALAAARLVHPNIVQVYDFGFDEPSARHFIVMEFVPGRSCAEILRDDGPMTPEQVVDVAVQADRGLDYAHRNGVVHRDVKPGNLMVTPDGIVKLADFGIAKGAGQSSITQVGSVLGTAAYLAPEQARGEEAGPASDLYSLGVVTYQLMSGRLPYEATSLTELAFKQQNEPPMPLHELVPGVPRCRARCRMGEAREAAPLAMPKSMTLTMPSRGDHDVPGLDVAVDDRRGVGGARPRQACAATSAACSGWWSARRRGGSRPGAAGHVLHDDEVACTGLVEAEVVDLDDVGVHQARGRKGLAAEARHERGVIGEVLGQELDRDGALQTLVEGELDGGHAADAEPALEAVAAGDAGLGHGAEVPPLPPPWPWPLSVPPPFPFPLPLCPVHVAAGRVRAAGVRVLCLGVWVSVDAVDGVLSVDSVDAVLSVDAVDGVLSVVAVVSVCCWLSAHSDAAVARRRARPCWRSALSLGSTLLGSCWTWVWARWTAESARLQRPSPDADSAASMFWLMASASVPGSGGRVRRRRRGARR